MKLDELVRPVIKRIKELEKERSKLAGELKSRRNEAFTISGELEENVVNKVTKIDVNADIGGVDGGLLFKSLHGIDIIVCRGVGAIFSYRKGKLLSSKVFDGGIQFYISETESDAELSALASAYRVLEELKIATKIAKFVDFLLLDGTVYPHPGLESVPLYDEVRKAYEKLVGMTKVIGVVKDSRSRFVSEKLFGTKKFRDTVLLDDVLFTGERTFTFKIPRKDLDYGLNIYGFYMKIAPKDRPIRIEFVSRNPKEDADEIASLVYSLAVYRNYAVPSVLIEADIRAKLPANFLDLILGSFFESKSTLVSALRRERRPL